MVSCFSKAFGVFLLLNVASHANGFLDERSSRSYDVSTTNPPRTTVWESYHRIWNKHGNISSIGYPNNYPNDYEDRYTIGDGVYNQPVTLRFKTFDLEYCPDCSCDYVLITPTNTNERSQKFCGSSLPNTNGYVYTQSSMRILFKSNSIKTSKGFTLEYTVHDPVTPTVYTPFGQNTESTSPVRWSTVYYNYVTLDGDKGSITSPSFPNTYPNNYETHYTVKGGPGGVMLRFKTFNLEYCADTESTSPVRWSTVYYNYVTLDGDKGSITSPSFPNTYPNNYETHYTVKGGPGGVMLRFKTFKLEYCADTESTSPVRWSTVYYNYVTLDGDKGSITSPSFPNTYPNNYETHYTVKGGPGGVMLRFKTFNLEYCADCACDYVLIIPLNTMEKRQKFCGSTLPNKNGYIYSNTSVEIVFKSDQSSNNYIGFNLTYSSIHYPSTTPVTSRCPAVYCPFDSSACGYSGYHAEYDYSSSCPSCRCVPDSTTYPPISRCPVVICPTCYYGYHAKYHYAGSSGTCPSCSCVPDQSSYPTSAYPRWQTTSDYPRWQTTSAYPRWQTTSAYPRWQTSSAYPRWQTSSAYPRWQTSSDYPRWQTSSAYPRWQTSSAYPRWQTSSAYPRWQTSSDYPTAITSSPYPRWLTTRGYPDWSTSYSPYPSSPSWRVNMLQKLFKIQGDAGKIDAMVHSLESEINSVILELEMGANDEPIPDDNEVLQVANDGINDKRTDNAENRNDDIQNENERKSSILLPLLTKNDSS